MRPTGGPYANNTVMTPKTTPQTGRGDVLDRPGSQAMITRSLAAALGRTPGRSRTERPFLQA